MYLTLLMSLYFPRHQFEKAVISLFRLCQVLVVGCGFFSCRIWGLQLAYGIFSCNTWDLVPQPRFELWPAALGAQSLSHWTTREVLQIHIVKVFPVATGNAPAYTPGNTPAFWGAGAPGSPSSWGKGSWRRRWSPKCDTHSGEAGQR